MEAVITSDILARAGIKVVRASAESDLVLSCANGMKIVADVKIQEVMGHLSDSDIIVLPGGMPGSQTFCKVIFSMNWLIFLFLQNESVQKALKYFAESKHVAAICAAPLALREAEIFKGSRFTCYPGLETQVNRGDFFVHDTASDTVVDGRLITSRGPGTAMNFALTIVQVLKGDEARANVACDILFH